MAGALEAVLDYEDSGCPVGMAGPVSWKGPGPLTLGEKSPYGLDYSPPDSYMSHEAWLLLTV